MRNMDGELRKMSSIARAQMLVREIAGNEGSPQERIQRAALRLQAFTYSRVRDFYRGEKRCRVGLDEFDELERVAKSHREEIEQSRHEYRTLMDRISRLETALRISDEEFHREAINGVQQGIHVASGDSRAMDKGEIE